MEMIVILSGLFIFVTLVFAVIALAYPEWVGITGKVAKRIQAEQKGDVKPPVSEN